MLVQSLIIGGTALALHYVNREPKDLREIRSAWDNMMKAKGTKDKNDKTFLLSRITSEPYGNNLFVHIPEGLGYEELHKLEDLIKTQFGALKIHMEWIPDIKKALIKLIMKDFDEKKFEIEKTKPYELFLGYDYESKSFTVNFSKYPHMLISGATNWGKSFLILIALINLLHQHKESQVYIAQISDKPDFEEIKHLTKGYTETFKDTLNMLKELVKLQHERNKLFKSKGVKNIKEYNKKFKTKLPYCWLVTDEFNIYMPGDKKTDKKYEVKTECIELLEELASRGRSVGIFLITALQRPDINSMNGDMKNNFNIKACTHANNVFSSRTMIDSDEAVDLQEREFIIMTNQRYYIKAPLLVNYSKYILQEKGEDKVEDKVGYIVDVKGEFIKSSNVIQMPTTEEEKPVRRRRRA